MNDPKAEFFAYLNTELDVGTLRRHVKMWFESDEHHAAVGDRLRERSAALIDLIRQAEWSCFIESAADDCCPWCKAARGRGTAESHEHTCPVVPVLYPKEP